MVEKGSFDIFVDKTPVAKCDRGKCFGELALMYDAPRSATVTAASPSVVWTVRRNAFRRAIKKLQEAANKQLCGFLKKIDVFKSLLAAERLNICDALELATYPAGKTLIKQGDEADKFYILKSGIVTWTKKTGSYSESGDLEEGKYFGELALINNEKRAATITTKTDVATLELSKKDFVALMGPINSILTERAATLYSSDQGITRMKSQYTPNKKVKIPFEGLKTIGLLGKGAFGVVTLVVDTTSKPQQSYALKAIKKWQVVELNQQSHIISERRVMNVLNSPFLVNLRATYKDTYRVYFLLDVCLGG